MDGLAGWPGGPAGRGVVRRTGAVGGGADSRLRPDEHAAEMDRRFPRNRRVLIKGAGHWVHSEQPEVFLEVVRRFLA